mgnify:CR=1 FL=1
MSAASPGVQYCPCGRLSIRPVGHTGPPRLMLACLTMLSLTTSAVANPWVDAYGPPRPAHVLGFAGIVAGVDSTGRIDTLLWPHSGGYNQLPPPPSDSAAPSGCQWGMDLGQQMQWLSQPFWKTETSGPSSPDSATLEVVSSAVNMKAAVTQTFIVSPKRAVLAVRIQWDTDEPVRKVAWFQPFAPVPSDRLPLALPVALPRAGCGFASFFDPQRARLYQFRPAHAGRQDWDHARRLQKNRAAPAEWESFPDGAWCAAAFSARETTCEFRGGETRARAAQSAMGQAAAIVGINPASGPSPNRAEVFIAFGKNRAEADQSLDAAVQLGFDALQSETQAEYAALLSPAMPRIGDAPEARGRALRDLRVLFAALDSNSGAAVGAPAHQPPVSATWPELAAWTALAWQCSGYPDQAGRQLQFFHAPLSAAENTAKVSAVLPELLRTDGTPVLPTFVRNPASAAWIVLAVVQVLRHSPPASVAADAPLYYSDLVLPAMRELRRWSLPASGGPSPGFDPVLFRDTSSVSNELAYYLAVDGALEVAARAKRPPEPLWQTWQRELDTMLRFRIVNETAGWDLSPTLAAWAAMTLAPENPLCKATVRTSAGAVTLRDCTIPALPLDPASADPDTFESAVDLVSFLQPAAPAVFQTLGARP